MNEILLCALTALWVFVIARWRRGQRLPLPPGPRSRPIVGNLLDMPTVRPWEKYRDWCQTYNSDIVYLDLPMQPTLVLGSAKAAIDLFDKRSNLWSDRTRSIILELMTWDFNIAFMPYNAKWRAHRRMFHQEFHQGVVNKYCPVQRDYARTFLSWINMFDSEMVTAIIFYITYGKRITGMNDKAVAVAQIAFEGLSAGAIPGLSWLEYFPLARHIPSWVPGTSSKKLAEHFLPYVVDMRDKPYEETKEALDKGTAPPSLTASLIERNREKYDGTDEAEMYDGIARNVAGIAYAAGADTTTASSEAFLLAMAMFPDAQKKAQAELDRVVGPNRLPEFEDIENMPYIRATVMETSRWLPVVPFGVPHAVIADDVYNGYHIPKGTAAIPNVWGMLHDPEDYPDPERFFPDRFIGEDGQINPTVRDPSTIAFGFGRRLCLGKPFSNNTLSIFIASVLHVFDIAAAVDASGKSEELSAEMSGGLIAQIRDVPTGLKPRSETAAALIAKFATEIEMT